MLTINGQEINTVVLPKYALDRIVPIVFEVFYSTDHFQIGVLLPLAILSCYGLLGMLESSSKATTRRDRALAYRFVGGRILS